jgi:hypothetical protein
LLSTDRRRQAESALLMPPLGNHCLSLAMLVFRASRGIWLAVCYLRIARRLGFVAPAVLPPWSSALGSVSHPADKNRPALLHECAPALPARRRRYLLRPARTKLAGAGVAIVLGDHSAGQSRSSAN